MKTWFYLLTLIAGIAIGALLVHGCEFDHNAEGSKLIKDKHPDSTLVVGKSDTTFSKVITSLRWIRESCHKNHYPKNGKIIYVDSNGVESPVVKRFISDSAQIGKATIYIQDTTQGELVSRKVGCKGCDPDTLRISRVDTLRIVSTDTLKKLVVKPALVSDGLQVTVGFPILPWLVVGYGAQFNLRQILKKKTKVPVIAKPGNDD